MQSIELAIMMIIAFVATYHENNLALCVFIIYSLYVLLFRSFFIYYFLSFFATLKFNFQQGGTFQLDSIIFFCFLLEIYTNNPIQSNDFKCFFLHIFFCDNVRIGFGYGSHNFHKYTSIIIIRVFFNVSNLQFTRAPFLVALLRNLMHSQHQLHRKNRGTEQKKKCLWSSQINL